MVGIGAVLLFTSVFDRTEQPTIWELFDIGEKHLRANEYEQALATFLDILDNDPNNPRGYTGAAEAYAGLGRAYDAMSILELGLSAIGESVSIRKMLDDLAGEMNRLSGPGSESGGIPDDEMISVRNEAYKAYYELLTELVSRHGLFGVGGVSDFEDDHGLWRATLIDFDNDGIDELVIYYEVDDVFLHARERGSYSVYGYDIDSKSTYLIYNSVVDGLQNTLITLFRGQDGGVYLRVNDGFRMGYVGAVYYTVENGEWKDVLRMYHHSMGGVDDGELWIDDVEYFDEDAAKRVIDRFEAEVLFSFTGLTGWGVFIEIPYDNVITLYNNINEVLQILAAYAGQ